LIKDLETSTQVAVSSSIKELFSIIKKMLEDGDKKTAMASLHDLINKSLSSDSIRKWIIGNQKGRASDVLFSLCSSLAEILPGNLCRTDKGFYGRDSPESLVSFIVD
jgi:hypothetical protein